MLARPDEEFELLLADLDRKVAEGIELGDTTVDGNAELSDRLDSALDCLQTLERIWPRAASPSPLATPRTLGRFRLVRELGRGGFGIVYLAEDPQLGRDVALKVQRPEAMLSPSLRSRFIREAHSAAALKHPHIVTVFDSGEDGLWCWIAAERVSGPSLSAYLAEHPFPSIGEACRLVLAMADAVAHAHAQGILHRDLKPGNVLLEPRVGQPSQAVMPTSKYRQAGSLSHGDSLDDYTPKLTDFSLAKVLEDENSDTRTGARLGTPAYMAPEQVEGRRGEIGPPTDVYGLGVLLYQLLAGRTPFAAEMESEILKGVLLHDPPSIRKSRKEIPRDLEAIVLKALSKQPANRYQSPAAMATDLQRFLAGQSTEVRPQSVLQRTTRWIRRHPAICIGIAFVMLATGMLVSQFRQTVLGVRTVVQSTMPSGARMVIVPLDKQTGEPLADQVIRPRMRSPVTQELAPGDYLVVVVWDDGRFHEVLRHVPTPDETIPEAFRHRRWSEKEGGKLEFFTIVSPPHPPDSVTDGMVLFDGLPHGNDAESLSVAPFYLERFEYTNAEFVKKHGAPVNDVRNQNPTFACILNFDHALLIAEKSGKRLPTVAEFRAAQQRCRPLASSQPTTITTPDLGQEPPVDARTADEKCLLSKYGPVGIPADDFTDTVPTVVGLRSNVAEWTSSALRESSPHVSNVSNMLTDRRFVMGGDGIAPGYSRFQSRVLAEPGIGFRFARSARPRFMDATAAGK